jgi:chromosome segregation ATPase
LLFCPDGNVAQKHKKETQEWLAAQQGEIDRQKAANAAESTQLNKDQAKLKQDQAKLKQDQAKLVADTEALDVKVAAFEESRKQMEAIMNRIKGIS